MGLVTVVWQAKPGKHAVCKSAQYSPQYNYKEWFQSQIKALSQQLSDIRGSYAIYDNQQNIM